MSRVGRRTHITRVCCAGYRPDRSGVSTAAQILNAFIPGADRASSPAVGDAQRQTNSDLDHLLLTQQIPVDAQITVGQLPNGVRYYVRANKKPENLFPRLD